MKKAIFVTALFLFYGNVFAQGKDTLRVLFVGNSYIYYNNLIQMVSLISDSLDTKLICTKSTVGGSNLREHWNGERGLQSKQLIERNRYDFVVIQDQSMRPLEYPDSLQLFGRKFCQLISSKGAKPVIYNTWSRKATPQTQTLINKCYGELAASCGSRLAAVGDYWQEAIKLNPEIELYAKDGSHPSHLGTFLTAMVFVKALTGKLPRQMATIYNYYDRDGETFRIMQVSQDEISLFKKVMQEL